MGRTHGASAARWRRRSTCGVVLALAAIAAPVPLDAAEARVAPGTSEDIPSTSLGTASPGVSVQRTGASRYLVRMRSEEALIALADERAEQGVPVTRMWKDAIDGFAAVLTPNEVTALQNNPDVLSVDPPQLITLSSTQITPPWGLDRIDQRNRPLSGSYTYTSTGAGVDAYVLDTGIRGTHTEFTGRIPRGAYVDFGDGTGVADCNGHGTHVAGTLGGTSYGVAKGVDIIPVKVFDCDGWTMEELIISGLDWIISDHEAGQPAVLNMSLGGPASNTLDAAVNAAINDGIDRGGRGGQ